MLKVSINVSHDVCSKFYITVWPQGQSLDKTFVGQSLDKTLSLDKTFVGQSLDKSFVGQSLDKTFVDCLVPPAYNCVYFAVCCLHVWCVYFAVRLTVIVLYYGTKPLRLGMHGSTIVKNGNFLLAPTVCVSL